MESSGAPAALVKRLDATMKTKQTTVMLSPKRLSGSVGKIRLLRRVILFVTIGSMGALIVALITIISRGNHSHQLHAVAARHANSTSPRTLGELLAIPTPDLANYDVASLNLLCAEGLPGAEFLNLELELGTLDQWAVRVKSETQRNLYRFHRSPSEFENSEAYFRMLMMAAVLYEDCGIRYNPARVAIPSFENLHDRFFADSQDVFLHGLTGRRRMGTCSSMPVLYLAIGRRLGYPLKLATTKAHLFIRWEDSRERFNLETTGRGMNKYDDEHFKRWPFPVTDEEIRTVGYLKSLTPVEELAVFLSLRGNCLKEIGRLQEAAACYVEALKLVPESNAYKALLADASRAQHGAATSALSAREPVGVRASLPSDAPPQAVPDPNPLKAIQ